MSTNDDYRIQAMNRKQAEREAKRETFGNDYKFDRLNGGRMKPEYIEENQQAERDAYNHTVRLSEGFQNWLNESIGYQEKARQEQAQRMREQMFPPKEIDPLSREINAVMRGEGVETDYQFRCRMRDRLFPDAEIERRRTENETNRHPMDIAMRERLQEREAQKKAR